jgi:hypothetical protein
MSLNNPDSRRATRTVVQAIVVLVMVGETWWFGARLDVGGLRYLVGWLCTIIFTSQLGYIMENGLRSISFKLPGGGSADLTSNDQASTTVTTPVQTTAESKGETQ